MAVSFDNIQDNNLWNQLNRPDLLKEFDTSISGLYNESDPDSKILLNHYEQIL